MSSIIIVNGTVNGDIKRWDNNDGGFHVSFTVQDYFKKTDRNTGEKSYVNLNYDVTLWGKQADNALEYLSNGKAVTITGHFKGFRHWEKNGKEGDAYILDQCIMDFAARDKNEQKQNNGTNRTQRAEPVEEMDLS